MNYKQNLLKLLVEYGIIMVYDDKIIAIFNGVKAIFNSTTQEITIKILKKDKFREVKEDYVLKYLISECIKEEKCIVKQKEDIIKLLIL